MALQLRQLVPDPGGLPFELFGIPARVRFSVNRAEQPAAFLGQRAEGTEPFPRSGQPVPGVPRRVELRRGLGGELFHGGLLPAPGLQFLLHHRPAGLQGRLIRHVLLEEFLLPDQVVGQQPRTGVADIELDPLGAAGHVSLLAERRELAPDLAGQVAQALQVRLHGLQLADGLFLAAAVFEDPGGLLDEAAAVLRGGVQDLVQLALAHDDMHFPAQAGIGKQLLDVEQAAAGTVDGVFGSAGAEECPRDGDFAVLDGQGPVSVVDGQGDVGPAQRRPPGRPGKNDVLHFAAAQGFGSLLPHHPGQGVHHVGLPGTVRPHHCRDSGLEVEGRGRRERLEPPDGKAFEVQGVSGLLSG